MSFLLDLRSDMQTHPLRKLVPEPVEAYGAMDFGARGDALTVSRLSAWTRSQPWESAYTICRDGFGHWDYLCT